MRCEDLAARPPVLSWRMGLCPFKARHGSAGFRPRAGTEPRATTKIVAA
jgi:hypothetical protein